MSVKDVINSPEVTNDVRGALRDWLAGKNDIMIQVASVHVPGVQRFYFDKKQEQGLIEYIALYLKEVADAKAFYFEVFVVGGPWWLRIARHDYGSGVPMATILQEMLK